jgi:hypothetical protein
MATNEDELAPQPTFLERLNLKTVRAVRDYAVPLGALLAGLAVHVVPEPFTAVAVIFVVLAILEYER